MEVFLIVVLMQFPSVVSSAPLERPVHETILFASSQQKCMELAVKQIEIARAKPDVQQLRQYPLRAVCHQQAS